jgi:hypothetical protein
VCTTQLCLTLLLLRVAPCVHTNRLGPAYTTTHSSSSGGSFNSGSYSNGSATAVSQPPVTVFSESLSARGLTLSLSSQTAILREALERTGCRRIAVAAYTTPLPVPLSYPLIFRPTLDYRCVYIHIHLLTVDCFRWVCTHAIIYCCLTLYAVTWLYSIV